MGERGGGAGEATCHRLQVEENMKDATINTDDSDMTRFTVPIMSAPCIIQVRCSLHHTDAMGISA